MSDNELGSERSPSIESLGYEHDEPLLNYLLSPNKKRRRPTHPNTPDCSSSEEDVVEAIMENVRRLGPAPPGWQRPSDDPRDPGYEAPGGPDAGKAHYEFRFNEGEKPVKVLVGGVEEFTRAPSPESPVSPATRNLWRSYDRGQAFVNYTPVAVNQAFYQDLYEQRMRAGTPPSTSSINSDDFFYTDYRLSEEITRDFPEINYAPPPPMQDSGSVPLPDEILKTFTTPEQEREEEEHHQTIAERYAKMAEEEKRVKAYWRVNYSKNKKPGGAASIVGQPSSLVRPPVPGFHDESSSQRTHGANGQSTSQQPDRSGQDSGNRANDNTDPNENANNDGQRSNTGQSLTAGQSGGDEGEGNRDSSDEDSNRGRKRKGSTSSTESDRSLSSSGSDESDQSPRKKPRTFKKPGPRPPKYQTPEPPTPSDSISSSEDGRPNRSFNPSGPRPRDYRTPSVPHSAKSSLTGSSGSGDRDGGADRRSRSPRAEDTISKSPFPDSSVVTRSSSGSPPLYSRTASSSSSQTSLDSDDLTPPFPPPFPPFPPPPPPLLPPAPLSATVLQSIESSDDSGIEIPHDLFGGEDSLSGNANSTSTGERERSRAPSPPDHEDPGNDNEGGDDADGDDADGDDADGKELNGDDANRDKSSSNPAKSLSRSSPSPPPGRNWPNTFLEGVHPFSNPARSGLLPPAIDSPSESESSSPPPGAYRFGPRPSGIATRNVPPVEGSFPHPRQDSSAVTQTTLRLPPPRIAGPPHNPTEGELYGISVGTLLPPADETYPPPGEEHGSPNLPPVGGNLPRAEQEHPSALPPTSQPPIDYAPFQTSSRPRSDSRVLDEDFYEPRFPSNTAARHPDLADHQRRGNTTFRPPLHIQRDPSAAGNTTPHPPATQRRPRRPPSSQPRRAVDPDGSPIVEGQDHSDIVLPWDDLHLEDDHDTDSPSPPPHIITPPPASSSNHHYTSSSIEIRVPDRPAENVPGRRAGPDGSPVPRTHIPEDPQSLDNNQSEDVETAPFEPDENKPDENDSPRTQANRRTNPPRDRGLRDALQDLRSETSEEIQRSATGLGPPPEDESRLDAGDGDDDRFTDRLEVQRILALVPSSPLSSPRDSITLPSGESTPLSSPDSSPTWPGPGLPPHLRPLETWATAGRLRPRNARAGAASCGGAWSGAGGAATRTTRGRGRAGTVRGVGGSRRGRGAARETAKGDAVRGIASTRGKGRGDRVSKKRCNGEGKTRGGKGR